MHFGAICQKLINIAPQRFTTQAAMGFVLWNAGASTLHSNAGETVNSLNEYFYSLRSMGTIKIGVYPCKSVAKQDFQADPHPPIPILETPNNV